MDLSGAYDNLIAPLAFSSANFDSGDAGSGAYADVREGVEHLVQHHMNLATGITEDERDFLRPWRRRLRDIIAKQNETIIGFLEKPAAEWPAIERHTNFLRALVTSGISNSSIWMTNHVANVIENDVVLAEINSELDVPLDMMRTTLHTAMSLYLQTLPRVFDLNASISDKLNQLNELTKKMDTLTGLTNDPTDTALVALQDSILKYIQSRYDALNIKKDYTDFMKEYARFTALRSLMLSSSAGGTDPHGNPICSICTVDRVTSALNPCGHVFCNNCSQKQRTLCYVCRTPIRDRLRIYFV